MAKLNIPTKQAHPNATALMLQYGEQYFLKAEETNEIVSHIRDLEDDTETLKQKVEYSDTDYDTIAKLAAKIKALEYVPPAISGFSNNSGSPVRMGVTISSITFSWSLNKAVTSQSINNGIGSIDPAARTKTATVSINSNTSFTLTVSDGTTTRTANTSVNFLNDRYWGTSAETALNNAQILALNNELSGSRGKTFTINGNGRYIYYIWPKRLGTAGVKVNGLDFTAVTVSEQDVTNAAGYTERYYVLRTDTIQNGTLNIQIT